MAIDKLNNEVGAENNWSDEVRPKIEEVIDAVNINTTKVGITAQQASDIANNNEKRTYPQADEDKLRDIEDNATADQTGSEIVSSIDMELGQTDWKTGGEGGASNPNIFIPTQASDFTSPDPANANKIWEIQSDINLAYGVFTAPANIVVFLNGGNVLNIGSFTGNNTSFKFVSDSSVFDLFSATFSGTVKGHTFKASNFGAKDDGLTTTDHKPIGRTLLDMVNMNAGRLVWNKIDTGIYYTRTTTSVYTSPFFPGVSDEAWLIGNGNDNVEVVHDSNVEVRVIPSNDSRSNLYVFFNTNDSIIRGGTVRGDRHDHDYEQYINVEVGATNASTIELTIDEQYPYVDAQIKNSIVENINLSVGSAAVNTAEITAFINNQPSLSDYTAIDNGDDSITIKGQAGVYFKHKVNVGSTGATITPFIETYEGSGLIVFGSISNNCKLLDLDIVDGHGDGIVSTYHGNGTSPIQDVDMTVGDIGEDGTIDVADTSFYHMAAIRDLPDTHPWFAFSSNANTTVNLKHFRYWIAFYDDNDVFIEKSKLLIPYFIYYTKPEWKRYRVIIDDMGSDLDTMYMFINSRSSGSGATIDRVDISHCRRQGISNPPIGYSITNSKIHDIGGALPEYGIDEEDNHKHQINSTIGDNEFWNNTGGDIILKGPSQVSIFRNKFRGHTSVRRLSEGFNNAIATVYARGVAIYDNHISGKSVSVDIGVRFFSNEMQRGKMLLGAGNSMVNNNVFKNVIIADTRSEGSLTNGGGGAVESIFMDNIIAWNEGWGNARFMDEYNTIHWKGNKFRFNDKAFQHSVASDTYPVIEVGKDGDNLCGTTRTAIDAEGYRGSYEDIVFEGLEAVDEFKYDRAIGLQACDIKGVESSMSVEIGHGIKKDFTIDGDGKTIKGWFKLNLNQFGNTDADFATVVVKNIKVETPVEMNWAGQTSFDTIGWLYNRSQGTVAFNGLITTENRDVNVLFEDCEFVHLGELRYYFVKLEQNGYLTFDRCKFENKTTQGVDVIDLTDSWFVDAASGAVTFIDCDFTNITVTLRAQDKILYTKPNANCQTYADNATAVADMGVGYYYKDSSNGNKFEITY